MHVCKPNALDFDSLVPIDIVINQDSNNRALYLYN